MSDGQIEGDLILQGGGDPVLDTDAMGGIVAELKAKGIHGVKGRFRIDPAALPSIPFIDPDQPDHVGYNPAISGLNLNFNRVHFEWKRGSNGYDVTMQARDEKYRPAVAIARMAIEDRSGPVYSYETRGGVDRWTVARKALGNEGSRWLPVKRPADYAAEVFMTLARSHGIQLDRGKDAPGSAGTVLVERQSDQLGSLLKSMLRYSTNLTAETVGLAATQASGAAPGSLIRSARSMNLWMNRELGTKSCGFVDHSGLGYGARVSPADMVHVLRNARTAGALPGLLKQIKTEVPGAKVHAKTGTLNFVSALAGYIDAPHCPPLAFAVFTADMPRRDAIPVEQRERPPGARSWASRSRKLQKSLIGRWVARASA